LHFNDLKQFNVDGEPFSIYTTSFLGYGANEARRRFLGRYFTPSTEEADTGKEDVFNRSVTTKYRFPFFLYFTLTRFGFGYPIILL
jgi:hypothetical protein